MVDLLSEWGYLGMFLSAFLSGSFIPFASELVMLACLASGCDPVLSVLSASVGNTLGGLTCYWIGTLGKKEWFRYLRITEQEFEKARKWIKKKGAFAAFFSFIPVLGDALILCLGWMRANIWIVTGTMAFGKILRYGIIAAASLGFLSWLF